MLLGRCNFRLCRFTVSMSGPRTQCFFSVSKVHESIMMWVNSLNIAYNYKIEHNQSSEKLFSSQGTSSLTHPPYRFTRKGSLVPTSPTIFGLGNMPQPNSTLVFGPSLISNKKPFTRTNRTTYTDHRVRDSQWQIKH